MGLLVLENKLKEESAKVIQTLSDCDVRTIMATGDNVLTAISVARQCKILDPNKIVYLGEKITDIEGVAKIQWKSSQVSASLTEKTHSND